MSGPVTAADAAPGDLETGPCETATVEISDPRIATVGAIQVARALPRKGRRTVGAWCFADHMGPVEVTSDHGLDIGPHPHTGLQTVTWLVSGEVLHRDSLGSEQVIRPGQLNLMTAGHGVAHAEEATGSYAGTMHGMQLWVAQPEATRHEEPDFAHHDDLPKAESDGSAATVLVGSLAGATSPARHDTPLVGAEIRLRGRSVWPVRPDFEYALIVLQGTVRVENHDVRPSQLAYLGEGRDELALGTSDAARVLLLGGEPFPEPIRMWWNFVARGREEIELAARQWNARDARFGSVSSPLARIPAPVPLWAAP